VGHRVGRFLGKGRYKPHQATSTSKAPALVWVHGGPGGQTISAYSSVIQYLVNNGTSCSTSTIAAARDTARHSSPPTIDDIVAAVKKNGVPVEYVVFADEGHGFTKKKNQIEGYSAVLKVLDQHLKGKAGTSFWR
jgi:dipeptidyl aminopeptidase/acylaminoacyl peptidase